MRIGTFLLAFWAALFAGSAVFAADAPPAKAGRILEGPVVRVGNGSAHTVVTTDAAGAPTTIGIVMTAGTLDGLPKPAGHMSDFQYELPMPKGVSTTVNHVVIDWEAAGHPPPGVYDVPHFDFHFYMISKPERMKIAFASDAASGDPSQQPPADSLPPGYIVPPGTAVPHMGVHAIDPAAPEFHGQPFKTTFIYGYYNKTLAFYEPMASLAFLQSKPSFAATVARPKTYPKPGLYPSSYSIEFDSGRHQYEIVLRDLKP